MALEPLRIALMAEDFPPDFGGSHVYDLELTRRLLDLAGRVVDSSDEVGLLDALDQLLGDPALARAMGERARKHVERFSWEQSAAVLDELLSNAARNR